MFTSRFRVLTSTAAAVAVTALLGACGTSGGTAASAAKTTTTPAPTTAAPTTSRGVTETTVAPAASVAVRPLVTPSASTFEGFAVYSYIPAHPVGVVYLFHGTGGGADFATKLETVDLLNTFTSRGYGYVATESTNRTTKQWDIADASMTTNPDLARMARLREDVVATTAVAPTTPTYGIGMSNGSAFVGLWATASTGAGMPVGAIGMYMAGVTASVRALGGIPVPTFMVVGQNDTRTFPAKERNDLAKIAAAGVPTELHEVVERPVTADRYLRVPGVDPATADAIVAAYRQAGLIDASGKLAVTLPRVTETGQGLGLGKDVQLPASLTPGQRQAVSNETLATIGEHQFNAEFKVQNADFFAAHATA